MPFLIKKKIAVICSISMLAVVGCKPLEAPVEQVQRVQFVNKLVPTAIKPTEKISVVKSQTATEFLCKDDVVIKVQRYQPKKDAKSKRRTNANQAIALTYGNAKHTLSPVVAKVGGKKYSNIRWTWFEGLDGIAVLSDNSGNILASDCKAK
ncbi:opacity associated protein B [Actinobacillus lignieresii]|nr:GlcNAc transferase [Actinobacillus lignieresii]VEB27037.1 opacity associated protein B [Actinobacillus lignieresii]